MFYMWAHNASALTTVECVIELTGYWCCSNTCLKRYYLAPQASEETFIPPPSFPSDHAVLQQSRHNQALKGFKVPCLHQVHWHVFPLCSSNSCTGPHQDYLLPYQGHSHQHLYKIPHLRQIQEILWALKYDLVLFISRGGVKVFDIIPGFLYSVIEPFYLFSYLIKILSHLILSNT